MRALVFLGLFASYAFFFQGGGWNQNSRLALTRALADRGSIAIDGYHESTGDWAFFEGHYYSNKAPGLSFLAVPPFVLGRAIAPQLTGDASLQLSFAAYVANLVVNALPAAVLGLLMLHVFARLGLPRPGTHPWIVLAYGLATPAFPYATTFYSHQPAALLGFAAFACVLEARAREATPERWLVAAGALAGLAVLVEHTAAITVIGLGSWLLADGKLRRGLPGYVLGGVPAALALGAYNAAAFGHPLSLVTAYPNPAIAVRGADGALFGWPAATHLYGILFSGYRGLFAVSPFLLLALPGWPALRAAAAQPAWLCAGVASAYLLLNASFNDWAAGFSTGPRYIVASLPFWACAAAFGALRFPRPAVAAGLASLLIATSITAVAVDLPIEEQQPLLRLVLPTLRSGYVSADPYSFDARVPDTSQLDNMHSFNLGEALWPYSTWSLLPLLVVWVALAGALWQGLRSDP